MAAKDPQSVLDLFCRSVQESAGKHAVEDGQNSILSYRQLDLASSKLAHYLKQCDVNFGQPIPLLATSCCDMVVGVLGILKAGGCYVPLDRAQWPREKIDSILERIDADLIVYTGVQPDIRTRKVRCVSVEDVLTNSSAVETVKSLNDDYSKRMCIIFTSGTTDKPKGVILTHASVLNLVSSPPFNFAISKGDRMLLVLSLAFDAFMGALFSTICNSGTVVLASPETIQERAVTANVFAVTPSILDALSLPTHRSDYPELKRVILGGETPSQRLIKGWSSANVDFWIAYGPTEATCTILTGLLQADRETGRYHTTRLGQSVPNSTITLVDENLQEVNEIGIEGEIFVSGHCLAEGYWGDKKLTETKFIQYQNDRTYRTGDMAKWVVTESGSRMLDFLGRRDRITKVRGFLVNLSQDLDAKVMQLDEHITFSFSLVINGLLVSVVGPEDVDTETLIARWKATSPAYMVPDHLVALSHLPMMNGKTDVKALTKLVSGNLPSTVNHVGSVTCTLDEAIMMALSQVTNIPIDHFDTKKSAVNYGVHSLTAIKVSTLCRDRGFAISVRDILLAPSIQALIDDCVTKGPTAPSHIQASYRTEEVALTPLQRGLLLATLEDPSVNYVQHISHYATSDIPRISAAWESLALTEPLFRMTFSWLQAEPTQSLQLRPTFNWDEMVVKTQQEINMALHELTTRADLGSSFAVLHCEGDELESGQSIVVWTVHHALIDGYSASLIFQKVDHKLHGNPTESSLPFTVAVQDMDRLRLETAAEAQKFWREIEPIFPKASGEIIFPSLSHSSRKKGHAQIHVPQSVDQGKIEVYAQAANITPAAIYNAAWVLLLASYTGSDAIAYGAVFSGRSLPFRWTETMLGPLIDTSPVVVEIDRQQNSADFLQQMHRSIQYLSSFHGSHLPSNVPSFSTTVTVQDKESAKGLSAVKQFREPYFRNTAATPLNLVVNPDGKISIFYRTENFLSAQIENIGAVYSNLLSVIMCGPVTVQKCLDLKFPLPMRQSLLATGNFGSSANINCDAANTISDLFRIAANQHSSRAAIQRADITLTYSKLSSHVDKVASIISCLVPPGYVVAVLADRSINWIVAMLAAMQADTIYCPVDASYSAEYRTKLLERSEARLLLVPDSLQISVVGPNGPLTLAVDNILSSRIGPVNLPTRGPRPSSTAYICFTSGSTGQPKGVLCRHRSIVALYAAPAARPTSRPGARIAQMLSPGFDGCIHEILSTLCFGSTLVLRREQDDVFSHLQDVDVAILTPSVASELSPEDYPNLKSVHFGGEPVPEPLVERWAAGRTLYNIYGPTETSLLVCHHHLKPGGTVSLGRPLPSARIYILNEQLDLQPPFVVGTIFIAGVQVAQGYHNMENKTSEEILLDPFCGSSTKEMMFRSGDLGFWDEQGNLHCCGRNDRQVKMRGFRINLDDITTIVLQEMPSVRKSVATAENGVVVVWVEPKEIDTELLKRKLSQALPPHAVPQKIFALERLPQTQNGKVDTKALASRAPTSQTSGSNEALTSMEKTIAEEWRRLLALDKTHEISCFDNFAALGGHSLLQLALVARLKKIFHVPITVNDVIRASSLRGLANHIQTYDRVDSNTTLGDLLGDQSRSLGLNDPSPAELEWIHRYQNSEERSSFNVPYVAKLSSKIDQQLLKLALEKVLNRHRILRSRFMTQEGRTKRSFSPNAITVPLMDDVDITAFIQQSFKLDSEDLIRVVISSSTLIICASHILFDLTALNVILLETADAYHGKELAPVKHDYFESTVWNQPIESSCASFWSKYLDGLSFLDSTPVGSCTQIAPRRSYRGASVMQAIPYSLYKRFLALSSRLGITLHQIGLAAVGFVLHALCGRDDIILGAPYMNRPDIRDMPMVGLFLQPLPVRVKSSCDNLTTEAALFQVRASSQSALAHAIPWHQLLNLLGLPFLPPSLAKQRQQQPLFDCVVTFHDYRVREKHSRAFPIDGVTPTPISAKGAKFSCLFEWQADNDALNIRYEYDTDAMPMAFITVMQSMIICCLERLLDSKCLMQNLRSEILQVLSKECQLQNLQVSDAHRLAKTFLRGV